MVKNNTLSRPLTCPTCHGAKYVVTTFDVEEGITEPRKSICITCIGIGTVNRVLDPKIIMISNPTFAG